MPLVPIVAMPPWMFAPTGSVYIKVAGGALAAPDGMGVALKARPSANKTRLAQVWERTWADSDLDELELFIFCLRWFRGLFVCVAFPAIAQSAKAGDWRTRFGSRQ